MRHHTLPARIIDWSENILVATFFAIKGAFEKYFNNADPNDIFHPNLEEDAAIYVINAHRLNTLSTILDFSHTKGYSQYNPGILLPDDLDVIARASLADHTYIDDAMQAMLHDLSPKRLDYRSAKLIRILDKIIENGHSKLPTKAARELNALKRDYEKVKTKLAMPVGVMPKRAHPRMDAQLSVFTLHGGKVAYNTVFPGSAVVNRRVDNEIAADFISNPVGLEEINEIEVAKCAEGKEGKPFLKKFLVSKFAIKRLMIELDRIGITEPMLFPEMDNQASFVTRRWSVIQNEREIIDLPRLNDYCNENDFNVEVLEDKFETLKRIYGERLAQKYAYDHGNK